MENKEKRSRKVQFLIQAAVIAAVYAALTLALAPFAYGVMQIRVSEALTILPLFTPAAVPGLFVGCILANLIGPYGILDVISGSIATLLAAVVSYKLRHHKMLVPLPPVIANALIVGLMLPYVYQVPIAPALSILWVGIGEAIACYGLGLPLMKLLEKYKHIFK